MDNIKKLNVTSISEIVYCDFDYYKNHVKDKLSEYRLYIVGSADNSTLDVYYGYRRLRDTLVARSYPSGIDYPCSKLYVRLSCFNTLRELIYKRSNGDLVELTQYLLIKEARVSHSSFEVVWNTDEVTKMIVLSADDEASEFSCLVIDQLVEDLVEEFSTRWEIV